MTACTTLLLPSAGITSICHHTRKWQGFLRTEIFNIKFFKLFFIYVILFFILFIYSHVHILFGSFLPLPLTPSLFPPSPLPGRTCSALISNFV
jgi:hypothetical protein